MNEEQEIKKEMSVREQPDSLEFSIGTPSKGAAIKIKCYFDASELDTTDDNKVQKKVDALLKIRQHLMKTLNL